MRSPSNPTSLVVGESSKCVEGADLSNYKDQLIKDRNSRTLNMRRLARPKISSISSKGSGFVSHTELQINRSIKSEEIIRGIDNRDSSVIQGVIGFCFDLTIKIRKEIEYVFKNQAIIEKAVESLNDSNDSSFCITMINMIKIIFPIVDEATQHCFIDHDLIFSLLSFLYHENLSLRVSCANLVSVLSEVSGYARDGFISFGLHSVLMEVAASDENTNLMEAACEAIQRIFSNEDPIETSIIMESIRPLSELLRLSSIPALVSILNSFIEVTNKVPSVVFIIYDYNMFPQIFSLLEYSELFETVLSLIGNLCVSNPPQIRSLLELGLFSVLDANLTSKFASKAFWIFSNMLESVPEMMISWFPREFIESIIDTIDSFSLELKKEAVYFLCTMVLFSDAILLMSFMHSKFADSISEMIGCGISAVSIRCIDALIRFLQVYNFNNQGVEFVLFLINTDILDRLRELSDINDSIITERAIYIANQLESFSVYDK